MTNWIIGQTQRFSAAVAMRSLTNLVSEYGQHDIVLWGTLELGQPLWPELDELWRRSPLRYVQNVRTPLLLTCGEMDLRTAISQSEEMFVALRLLGKTVEFVRFPEETHDLSRIGRPDRRVERLRRIANWYARFLGTASVDHASEEATQILERPEWAKTIGIDSGVETALVAEPESESEPQRQVEPALGAAGVGLAAAAGAAMVGAEALHELKPEVEHAPAVVEPVAEPESAVEPEPSQQEAEEPARLFFEPEVIKPEVPETATAEAPIIEPDALPDLPVPESPGAEPAPPTPDPAPQPCIPKPPPPPH